MDLTRQAAARFVLGFLLLAVVSPQRSAAQSTVPSDLVLYTADATVLNGTWQRVNDTTAAAGVRLWHPDAGAPKIAAPSATPCDYFENDTTTLPKTEFSSTNGADGGPVSFSTADYVAGGAYDLAAVADVNADGKPDVVSFYDNEPLEFWSFINNGDRTFTTAQFIEDLGGGQYGALALAVADFTQDGRKDVLFLHGTANALWLGTGNGAGSFTFATGAVTFAEKVTDFAVADFNRDGVFDVVTIEPNRNAAVIYQGDGNPGVDGDVGVVGAEERVSGCAMRCRPTPLP
jgi:hypothetical protein